jgi:hypothetical protein
MNKGPKHIDNRREGFLWWEGSNGAQRVLIDGVHYKIDEHGVKTRVCTEFDFMEGVRRVAVSLGVIPDEDEITARRRVVKAVRRLASQ